jgi:hypothetical protein
MSNIFNHTSQKSLFAFPQIQTDSNATNLSINCTPSLVTGNGESTSNSGKLAAEQFICNLEVRNLTVKGKITVLPPKLPPSIFSIKDGVESDYLFYDTVTECFQVGGGNVHIGKDSGTGIQGTNSVAIGENAGSINQGARSVAIGRGAGGSGGLPNIGQGDSAVAIGRGAGSQNQGDQSIAIGANSGLINQGENSIHIGNQAGASFTGGDNSTVISSSGGVGVGQYGANSMCLNSSDATVNASDDSQLVITTKRITTDTGLIEITDTVPISTLPLPLSIPNWLSGTGPGGDGRFTHYLVYDPDKGEIAACKICINPADCSISTATGGTYATNNDYFIAPDGGAPDFPTGGNTYVASPVVMTANLQAWGTTTIYQNRYPPITDIKYNFLQPSNHRAYLPSYYASGGGGGAQIWKPSVGSQIGISNGMWHSHLTCLNKQTSAFIFDSYWAMRDLQTTVNAIASPSGQVVAPTASNPSTITLQPNFNTWNPNDPFWVDPVTGEGNKIVELNTMLSLTATAPIALTATGARTQTEITIPYKYVIPTYDRWDTPTDPGPGGPGPSNNYWTTDRPAIEIWNKDIYFSGRVVLNTLSPDYTVTAYIRKLRPNVTPGTRSYEIIAEKTVDLTNRPSNPLSCGSFVVSLPGSTFPEISNTSAAGTNWPPESGSAGNWNRFPLQSNTGFFPESALGTVVNPSPAVANPTIGNTNYLVWVGFEVKGLNANPADEEKLGKIVITSCTYP